jgi:NhaA family Na+:H+ antiporter
LQIAARHKLAAIFGAGVLGGIGFTMSIFITNLAFTGQPEVINASKMAILVASLTAGTAGFIFLKLLGQPNIGDFDMDTMDFEDDNGNDVPSAD